MPPMLFPAFAAVIRKRFEELAQSKQLFVVDSDRDEIWNRYLKAFPPGTDPIYRVKTEHDCSCCRHFIRSVGNVVALKDGVPHTVWDIYNELKSPYKEVAYAMSSYITGLEVRDIFVTKYPKAGAPFTLEKPKSGDTAVLRWEHFSAEIPIRFIDKDPGTRLANARTAHDVLERGVKELSPDAVQTVLDLIDQDGIYRGAEHRKSVAAFQELQNRAKAGGGKALFWELHAEPAARFRNTVIGTLVDDLSNGIDAEQAVKSFESKVAPQNYKRPTAVITTRMVENAMKTITELDLEPALERRHARLSDVTVNNVLWVDNFAKGKLKGGIADKLMEEVAPAPFDPEKARPIGIDEFLKLPHKKGMQLYLGNDLLSNFVSMTAPVHPGSKSLFQWDNDFAWSYAGNVTDSLREKVASLGGRVDGAFRFSHTWNYDPLRPNKSLMDLHVFMPGNSWHTHRSGEHYPAGRRIGWNQREDYLSGGRQDVDYINPPPDNFAPVENISFPDIRKMPAGKYLLRIHNWSLREPTKSGFRAEVEFEGQVFQYEYREPMGNKEWVTVAEVTLNDGRFTIQHVLPTTSASQERWGLKTLSLVRVQAIVLSPNFWDDKTVGNKRWFFILEGCKNPEPCRGICNEFLHPRLIEHRKVFEVLAHKTRIAPDSGDQLSGVGFSSTRRNTAMLMSGGQAYAVNFGQVDGPGKL